MTQQSWYVKIMMLMFLSVLSACGGGGGSSASSSTGSLKILNVSATQLSPGQPGTLTVLYSSPNTNVNVWSSSSALVTFAASAVKTDGNGIATVPFSVGTTSSNVTVTLHASAGGMDVQQNITILSGTAVSQGMTPPQLAATTLLPGSSSNVTVNIADANGAGGAGVQVTFTSTLGTFNPGTGTATTDGTGKAVIQLIAGSVSGGGVLTATATVNGTKIVKSTTFVVGAASGPKLTLDAYSAGYFVVVTAKYSNPSTTVWSGVPITFSSSTGANVIVSTDASGYATAYYDVSSMNTGAVINFTAITPTVSIPATVSAMVLLPTASPTLTLSSSISGLQLTLTAKYADPNALTLAGVPITFTNTDTTAVIPRQTVLTDSNGTAIYVYNFPSPPTVNVINEQAETGGLPQNVAQTVSIKLTPSKPALALTTSVSGTQLTVNVKYSDPAANTLADIPVMLTSDQNALLGYPTGRTVTTDSSGNATAIYYLPAGASVSVINIIATYGSVTASTAVNLALSQPALTLSTAVTGAQITVTAKYTNPSATSLAGQSISIAPDSPLLVGPPQTVITDSSGTAIAVFTLQSAATTNIVTFTASNGTVSATATVNLTLSNPTLTLSSAVSGSQITVTAKYADPGAPTLAGVLISIAPDQPLLVGAPKTSTTDSGGNAVAVFTVNGSSPTSPVTSSLVNFSAAAPGNLNAYTPVNLTLSTLSLSLSPSAPYVGSSVIATATYSSPNSSTLAGVPVVFSTDNGTLFTPITVSTNASGIATATMPVLNGTTTPVTVTFSAVDGSITAVPQSVTVQPTTLSVIAPPGGSYTISDSCVAVAPATTCFCTQPASSVRFVPQGMFDVVLNGNNQPLAGQSVVLGLETVLNDLNDTPVTFWSSYPGSPYDPGGVLPLPTSMPVTTDSLGQIPNQTTVDAPSPIGFFLSGTTLGPKIITVVWKITYTPIGTTNTLVGYGTSQYSISASCAVSQ